MIDLHSHILPGLDDGARSLEDARGIAAAAAGEGVTAIVATPHVREDYPTTPDEMERALEEVRGELARASIDVQVLPGGEIALVRLPHLSNSDLARFTLAQSGRYVLLEFPYSGWPLSLDSALARVHSQGMRALIGHPERNPVVQARPQALAAAVAEGALIQVTAASLDGRLGRAPAAAARRLLRLGLVHVLATDSHAPEVREFGFAAATRALRDEGVARFLTLEAPQAIVAGEDVGPPPSPRRRRLLR